MMFLFVKRCQLFAGQGAANDDLMPAHPVQVKGVHGVAGLQHHKVGDIHDVVDASHAGGMQIGAQPQRRGGDAHILDDAPGIARAQVFIPYADPDVVCDIVRGVFPVIQGGQGERLIEHGGRLPGQAPDAQAVGPVGQHFHIDDLVVDA